MLFRVYGNSEVVHIHCTLGIEYCRKYNAEYGTAKCHTTGKKEEGIGSSAVLLHRTMI